MVTHAAETIGKVGFWSALTAAAATLAFVVVQLMQVAGALRFPVDEVLIYATSLGIVVPFVLAMLALHHLTANDRQYWSHAALIFTIVYAVFVTANYVVQLATVIPAKLRGDAEPLRLLDQTPHSLFWNFDAIGYLAMGIATLLAIPVFTRTGFERLVRWSFLAHALVTPLIAIVYFYPTFSERLLFLAFPWAITAPLFMLLLAVSLRKRGTKSMRC